MRRPDLTEDEWKAWLVHPTTQAFFGYLRDRQQALMEDWAAGVAMPPLEQGATKALRDITRIAHGDIMDFYDQQEQSQ